MTTAATALDERERMYWAALAAAPEIGAMRHARLIERLGTAEAAWRADAAELRAAGLEERAARALVDHRRKAPPEALWARIAGLGVTVLTPRDDAYPRLLAEIPDRPAVLYMRGELRREDELAVAVVGTRGASAYGREMTRRLAGELARQGVVIVSGLARGIDTVAHKAALEAGGRTIAVTGNGPDMIYPEENAGLARSIAEHGAVVTEFPPGTKPDYWNFPIRNRVISGMSMAVLVVEAPEKSGALHTARYAGEQGRDVFAVPGNVLNRTAMGANRLIQDGAKLIIDAEDVLRELNPHLVPQQLQMRDLLPADDLETTLLRLLRAAPEPQHVDDLVRASGLAAPDVTSTLLMLELKGLIRQYAPLCYVPAR